MLSATGPSLYLSTRAGGEWSTAGARAPDRPPLTARATGAASVLSLTEDLSEAIVDTEPGLEAGMAPGRYSYLRDNATGAFRLLAPGVARFADATADDSRIIFESREQLLPSAAPNVVNLYEWDESRPPGQELSLVGVLPDGKAPTDGSVAGPGGPALGGLKAARRAGSTRRTRSPRTARASSSATPGPGGSTCANRKPNGRSRSRRGSNRRTGGPRRRTARRSSTPKAKISTASTPASETREALTSGAAGVLGTLGIATENGSYAYFVATGVLADNENGNEEDGGSGRRQPV